MNNSNITSEFCGQIAEQVKHAEAWLNNNAKKNCSPEDLLVIREVSDFRRHISRLHTGFDERSCLALYGGSQVGKSYLVSCLAAEHGKSFAIKLSGKEYNFIDSINPKGGGEESTAVVTRFTHVNQTSPYTDFPVQIKLFSESDLIKILINTYYHDIDHDKSSESGENYFKAALNNHKNLLENAVTAEQNDETQMEIALDVREYLQRFSKHAERFQEVFWERLARLLSKHTDKEHRVKILSPLWGGIPDLDRIFGELYSGLLELQFSNQVYAQLSPALMPEENSIINVKILTEKLLAESLPSLEVKTPGNKAHELHPSILSALTAELIFSTANEQSHEPPWPFLKYADILDFPGARTREKYAINNSEKNSKRAGKMLLRGKVDYLYQRYLKERSINAMVVCINPSTTQEVKEIPGSVDKWVQEMIGRNPTERVRFNEAAGLIFNLARFDEKIKPQERHARLIDAKKQEDAMATWTSLFGCLADYKNIEWFKKWTNKKFNNITLFYNSPEFKIPGLFDYKESPDSIYTQSDVKIEKKEWLDIMKDAFIQHQTTLDHVTDSTNVWAGVVDADGGVRYLADRISRSFPGNMKAKQIKFNLIHVLNEVIKKMEGFQPSGEAAKELKKVNNLQESISKCQKNKTVGQFLCSLTADEKFCYRQLLEADKRREIGAPNPDPGASALEQAEYLKKAWLAKLSNHKKDSDYIQRYHLSQETMALIVFHLEKAFERLGISGQLQKELCEVLQFQRAYDETLPWRAKICSEKLSQFIRCLAIVDNESERTVKNLSSVARPFPPKSFKDLPPLQEAIQDHDKQYLDKWLNDFRNAVQLNLGDDSGKYSAEANRQLDKIMTTLKKKRYDLDEKA